jgi:hypothetical protein
MTSVDVQFNDGIGIVYGDIVHLVCKLKDFGISNDKIPEIIENFMRININFESSHIMIFDEILDEAYASDEDIVENLNNLLSQE